MGRHKFAAGAFFTYSPEISIRCLSDQDGLILEAQQWVEERGRKGGDLNCFLRAGSDEERDGHLDRLLGVQKMHGLLLELQDKATLKHHGEVKKWEVGNDEHPCGMLSFNDKWWMMYWNEKHLGRYGDKKREKLSCIPEQLRPSNFHRYAVKGCLYCNGSYDKTIQMTVSLNMERFGTTEGPWTE